MERKYKKYISEVTSQQEIMHNSMNIEPQTPVNQQTSDLLKGKKDFVQTRLPNFKGTISKAFEQYLEPFTERKKQELLSCINEAMNEDPIDENLKVFKSYLTMQSFIRSLISEASSYFINQLMIEISRVIKSGLKFYCDKLMTRMEFEFNNRQRDSQHFQMQVGYVINTSECWKENIMGLEDAIISKLDAAYQDNIDIQNESNLFADVINKGVEYYLQYVEWATDNNFNQLTKINWQQMEGIDIATDSNHCVKETKNFIVLHINLIKDLFSEKLALQINQKFINTVYKLKSLGEGAVPQLMVDATELETGLIDLAKTEQTQTKTIQNYVTNVKKSFNKTKNILKLLNMPNHGFVDNFTNFFEDATIADLEKLLVVKGIKKTEVPQLFKAIAKN